MRTIEDEMEFLITNLEYLVEPESVVKNYNKGR